jgi:hypothetical protein
MSQIIEYDADLIDPIEPAPELPAAHIAWTLDGREVVTHGAPGVSAEALAAIVGATDWREVEEGYTPPPSADELAEAARTQRDKLLAESDWTQLPDSPLSGAGKAAWAAYRQALRDISDQSGFPEEIIWPEMPA